MIAYKKHIDSSDKAQVNLTNMDKLLRTEPKLELTSKKLKLVSNSLEKKNFSSSECIKIKSLKTKTNPNSRSNTKKFIPNKQELSIIESSNKSLGLKSPTKLAEIKRRKKQSSNKLIHREKKAEKSKLMLLMQNSDHNPSSGHSNIQENRQSNAYSAKKLQKLSEEKSFLVKEKNYKSSKEVPNSQKIKSNKIPLSILNERKQNISPQKDEKAIRPHEEQKDLPIESPKHEEIIFKGSYTPQAQAVNHRREAKSAKPLQSKDLNVYNDKEENQSEKNEQVIFENTSHPGVDIDIKFCQSIGSITENVVVSKSISKKSVKKKKRGFLGCLPICF